MVIKFYPHTHPWFIFDMISKWCRLEGKSSSPPFSILFTVITLLFYFYRWMLGNSLHFSQCQSFVKCETSVYRKASYCTQRPEVKEHFGEEEWDLLYRWPGSSCAPRLCHRHYRHCSKPQSGNQKVITSLTDPFLKYTLVLFIQTHLNVSPHHSVLLLRGPTSGLACLSFWHEYHF